MDDKVNETSDGGLTEGGSQATGRGIRCSRRNALLKSAAASAPLFMALAPGAAVAASSALNAAIRDATQVPSGWASAKDGWVRVAVTYGVLTIKDGNSTQTYDGYMTSVLQSGAMVPVGTIVYSVPVGTSSGGTGGIARTITDNNPNSNGNGIRMTNAGTRYVLVLFGISTQSTANGSSYWPQYFVASGSTQALHCSSWSSIGPAVGTPPYNGC